MQSYRNIHENRTGNASDKWDLYLDVYHNELHVFQDKKINLLEIGVQNGGSLEVWSKYFQKAKRIIGCDINEDCRKLSYSDKRIEVLIGDATNNDFCEKNFSSLSLDVIIDDGAHTSESVIKAFCLFFDRLKYGGKYIIEDLHCSYWQNYQGGLKYPYSSMSFLKKLADIVNHEHWNNNQESNALLTDYFKEYKVFIPEKQLTEIASVKFINSMCVIEKKSSEKNEIGKRNVTGTIAKIADTILNYRGSNIDKKNQVENPWSNFTENPDVEYFRLKKEKIDDQKRIDSLKHELTSKQQALLQAQNRENEQLKTIQKYEEQYMELKQKLQNKEQQIHAERKRLQQELKHTNNTLNRLMANERTKLVRQYHRRLPLRLAGNLWRFIKNPLQYYRMRRDTLVVRRSGLFDDGWYLQQYPDLYLTTVDMLQHYMLYGAAEGRKPNPMFDAQYYLNTNPDVKEAGVNPLLHFVLYGWKEGRKPNKDFDPILYLDSYPDVRDLGINPLSHYILCGKKEGRTSFIKTKDNIKNLTKKNTNIPKPLYKSNRKDNDLEIIINSKYFDCDWYRIKYFDETDGDSIDLANHYLKIGWKEGKSPSKLFDGPMYLEIYCDVKDAGINPLLHYEKHGKRENRIFLPKEKEFSIIKPSILEIISRNLKSKKIKVSVIVTCNFDKDIDNLNKFVKTIDSVLLQKYNFFEIIITCNYENKNNIESFIKNDERLKDTLVIAIDDKLSSTAKMYEKAIQKSSGEYISFCDVDSVWDSTYLDEKIGIIKKYRNVNIVLNDVSFTNDFSNDFSNLRLEKIRNYFNTSIKKIDVIDNIKQNLLYSLSCCMVKSNVLKKINFEIPQTCDIEWWIWFQITMRNAVYYVNEPLVLFNKLKLCAYSNYHDVFLDNVISFLSEKYPLKLKKALQKINGEPFFSIIMATYNRDFIICKAIDSCLYQTYQNFELIIIDDGSTDNTRQLISERYKRALDTGRIRYYKQSNSGVCIARNEGLLKAKYNWIAYLDSDNVMEHDFLYSFACAIDKYHQKYIFYSKLLLLPSNIEKGQAFDMKALLSKNFIDLGVFVHHRKLIEELGAFDISLTRLVDWDLIIRYTHKYEPVFIEKVLLNYNNYNNNERITNSIEFDENYEIISKKNCGIKKSTVTTIITSYNHEKFISQAIESAIMQVGFFNHEIIISDDGSTDNTIEIINEYEKRYPNRIKNISSKLNLGISANMKKCFEYANGDYIAILEGDDYWSSKQKLSKQIAFLEDNNDCSMVFSMVKVKDEINGKEYIHTKQKKLTKNKLSGYDFIHHSVGMIANFSCCMYRSEYMKLIPGKLYENRLSEIALAFFLERYGCIGFINDVMSVYRVHPNGVWSGSKDIKKIESSIIILQCAKNVAAKKYEKHLENLVLTRIKKIETLTKNKSKHVIIIKDSSFFNEKWYLKKHPLLLKNGIDPAFYFLNFGWKEGDNPSESFDCSKYLLIHKDVERARINPLLHYELYGRKQNRIIFKENEIIKDYDFYKKLPKNRYKCELIKWYEEKTKLKLDLDNPIGFNEKMQWLKLNDSTPLKSLLADKYMAREWVANKIGNRYLIPLLGVWEKFNDINFNKLPNSFVLKCNHGCGWNIVVKNKKLFNPEEHQDKVNKWMSMNYSFCAGLELQYLNIEPKIIIEKYIEFENDVSDYKILCFNGRPKYIWVDIDRENDHTRNIYDLNWNLQPFIIRYKNSDKEISKPRLLNDMINISKLLAKDFSFVRVDLYESRGRIYFGELTFTSGSGIVRIEPEDYNVKLGDMIVLPKCSKIL